MQIVDLARLGLVVSPPVTSPAAQGLFEAGWGREGAAPNDNVSVEGCSDPLPELMSEHPKGALLCLHL